MKEFQHLKKIYDIKELCPASSSIEIIAKVDMSNDQSDLSPSDSLERPESFDSGDSDWDMDLLTSLEAEMNQTKEIEQVDPEVRFY